MTKSEELISGFSEQYFYKELVYSDLKFVSQNKNGTEVELADLLINLEDVVLVVQLKERNEKDRTDQKDKEEKWLEKRCKQAKAQINDTIRYIKNESVSFVNARGKETYIDSQAEIVPLVVFDNQSILEYDHLLRGHSSNGIDVNCISLQDYQLMCQKLISPLEIIEYVKWRQKFYKKNGEINLLITDTEDGILLSKPHKQENLVNQYLYERYGRIHNKEEDENNLNLFRKYTSSLLEHSVEKSEDNACYEIVLFLAHLCCDEIDMFVERVKKSLDIAKEKHFELVGSLRNTKSKCAMVFTSTESGEVIPSEKILKVVFEKQPLERLLQVIAYWIDEKEYRIDFVYWHI